MTKPTYEVRVFEKGPAESRRYDVSLILKRNIDPASKKAKKTQFCCSLKISKGKIVVLPNKRKGCYVEGEVWNSTNYVRFCKAIMAWFLNNVKTKLAYTTSDDAVVWHLKPNTPFGDRYTLYDCSLTFVTSNLRYWDKILSKLGDN
jgi:hypothetical protein